MYQLEVEKKSRNLLHIIVTTLVFEGLFRKMLPSVLGTAIFLLKDIYCLLAIYFISKNDANLSKLKTILVRYKFLLLWFLPVIIRTAYIDPILVLFGLKQYLLYVTIALLVPIAYPSNTIILFQKFALYFCILIIPTSLIAMLQVQLPPTHWLNLSVDGDSLENFSAAGKLRVTSTFSFTGQYSWFICQATGILFVVVYNPFFQKNIVRTTILNFVFAILLMIGAFVTGGRTAVIGAASCLLIGSILCACKYTSIFLPKALIGLVIFFFVFGIIREVKPDYFIAYEARSTQISTVYGDVGGNSDVTERTLGNFTNWSKWMYDNGILSFYFGNGIGVMSNGAAKISSYASSILDSGQVTETDMETVFWEGGIYLLIIWFTFRIWLILYCFRIWNSLKQRKFIFGSAFLFANILVVGLTEFIERQPPLSIWFFLSVGAMMAIEGFDSAEAKKLNLNS